LREVAARRRHPWIPRAASVASDEPVGILFFAGEQTGAFSPFGLRRLERDAGGMG
jgi:hypothetical protein